MSKLKTRHGQHYYHVSINLFPEIQMPTSKNEDKDFPDAQDTGALPDDTDEIEENPEENLSEVAMRINLLGKLVIPPPTP